MPSRHNRYWRLRFDRWQNHLGRPYVVERIKKARKRPPSMTTHKFGADNAEHPVLFCVKVTFNIRTDRPTESDSFDVAFDVIDGDLPFLVGLPSLATMGASLNFSMKTLGFKLSGRYAKLSLERNRNHILLPFEPQAAPSNREAIKSRSKLKRANFPPRPSAQPGRTHYVPGTQSSSLHSSNKTYYQSPDDHPLTKSENSTNLNSIDQIDHNNETPSSESTTPAVILSTQELMKLHKQLRHPTVTGTVNYLRSARLWKESYRQILDEIARGCACYRAVGKPSASPASNRPPSDQKQRDVAIDIVYLNRRCYLHIVDKCTGWSTTGHASTRVLSHLTQIFHKIYVLQHGLPSTVSGDQEFNKEHFLSYCRESDIEFHAVPAYSHSQNGSIERANKTLREYFDRLSASDGRSSPDLLVQEATYGKNISKGAKLRSSYELLYGHAPRISKRLAEASPASRDQSALENSAHMARRRVSRLLNAPHRPCDIVEPGDTILFWRDKDGWAGPGIVTSVSPNTISFSHNGFEKTAGPQYIKRVTKSNASKETGFESAEIHDEYDPPAPSMVHNDQSSETEENPTTSLGAVTRTANPRSPEINTIISRPSNQSTPVIPPSSPLSTPRLTGLQREARALQEESSDWIRRMEMRNGPRPTSSNLAINTKTGHDNDSANFLSSDKLKPKRPSSEPLTEKEKHLAYVAEKKNWELHQAFQPVDKRDVPPNANIIGSHVVYRRKIDGSPKGRIVPWGHRDSEKDDIRGDAPCLNLDAFRILCSISAENDWEIGQMDATAAFLQALGFGRIVYVRPPKEERTHFLWLLTAAAYGLKDSGRLWYITSNHSLIHNHGLTRCKTEYAAYHKHDHNGNLVLMVVTQVDNYMYSGTESEMNSFEKFLQNEFNIGELDRNTFNVMGCCISRLSDHSITLSQKDKMDDITTIDLSSRVSGRSGSETATPADHTAFKSSIGKILFAGRVSYPSLLFHASSMATKTPALQVHHLRDLASVISHAKRTVPKLLYDSHFNATRPSELVAYSDAALCGKKDIGGRAGFVIFRMQGDVAHAISWSARKLKRIARSSSTAELLGAADAVSHLLYLRNVLEEILGRRAPVRTRLVLDSHCLFKLCCTTNDPQESLNKIDLCSIRESFRPHALDAITWHPGIYHVADALTKDNKSTAALLMKVLREGSYASHPSSKTVESADETACPTPDDNLYDPDTYPLEYCNPGDSDPE